MAKKKVVDFENEALTEQIKTVFLFASSLTLLPPSGSFGVTKKAKAGRLGVSGRPLFLPKFRQVNLDEVRLAGRERGPPMWRFMQKTSDINVVETRALPSPAALLAEL